MAKAKQEPEVEAAPVEEVIDQPDISVLANRPEPPVAAAARTDHFEGALVPAGSNEPGVKAPSEQRGGGGLPKGEI